MNPISVLSQCSIGCLISAVVMLSSSAEAQYVYGVAGSRIPTPSSATGLPVFEFPRPTSTTGFDDAIEWASEKKIDPKHHEKEARVKAEAKRESQRREAEKRESEKRKAEKLEAEKLEAEKKEKDKRDTEKPEAEKREVVQQAQELSDVKKKAAAKVLGNQKEAAKPDSADDELRLKEPLNRDRVIDVWDRDLPTERPMQDKMERSNQDGSQPVPEAQMPFERQLMEMRAHRERLIREHGQDHPSVRNLNESLEQIERIHRGSRQDHSQNPGHAMGPHNIGPHNIGPHNIGPHNMGPHNMGPHNMGPHNMSPHNMGPHNMGPHSFEHQEQPIDSVGELERTIDSIDRIVERLVQQRQAIKNEQRDPREEEEDDDDDDDDDSNREQLEDLIQLQLELRHRIKNFQVEMLRIGLERAEIEAEIFEESLDAMHEVKVLDLLHR